MKSLLRFLLFVLIAAAAVGSVYIWKQTRPNDLGEADGPNDDVQFAPLEA